MRDSESASPSLAVLETNDGFHCKLPNCEAAARAYRKLAGLSSHQAFAHGVRSLTPYRSTSTRRGLDRKTGHLDDVRALVLAKIPKMHAPPIESIIPDIRRRQPLPVDVGELQFIGKRIEWTILALEREMKLPADNVRAALALILAPRKTHRAPQRMGARLSAATVPADSPQSDRCAL